MAYYRTVIQVEVLSEGPYEYTSLENLSYDVMDGDCSGDVKVVSSEKVGKKKMADLLLAQGSDPSFLIPDYEDKQ